MPSSSPATDFARWVAAAAASALLRARSPATSPTRSAAAAAALRAEPTASRPDCAASRITMSWIFLISPRSDCTAEAAELPASAPAALAASLPRDNASAPLRCQSFIWPPAEADALSAPRPNSFFCRSIVLLLLSVPRDAHENVRPLTSQPNNTAAPTTASTLVRSPSRTIFAAPSNVSPAARCAPERQAALKVPMRPPPLAGAALISNGNRKPMSLPRHCMRDSLH